MKDINLMPEEVKPAPAPKAKSSKKGSIPVKAVVIVVVSLVFVVGSILSPKIYVKALESQTSALQAEIESDKYKEVKTVNQQIAEAQSNISSKKEVIGSITSSTLLTTDIINFAQQAAPEGVTIDSLQCGEKGLSIEGIAKGSTAVAEYISNLTRLNAFADYSSKANFSYDKANVKLAFKIELSQTNQGV